MPQNHDFVLTVESNIKGDKTKTIPIRVRVFEEKCIVQVIQLDIENGTLQHFPYAIKLIEFLKEKLENGELKYYKLKQENTLNFSKKSPVKLQFLPHRKKGEPRSAFYFYLEGDSDLTWEDVETGDILNWDD